MNRITCRLKGIINMESLTSVDLPACVYQRVWMSVYVSADLNECGCISGSE